MSDKFKTLSQAMRVGATYRPQCYGKLARVSRSGEETTCAIGAAYEAVTGQVPLDTWAHEARAVLEKKFGMTVRDYVEIIHRNDMLKWKREAIADWLESLGL